MVLEAVSPSCVPLASKLPPADLFRMGVAKCGDPRTGLCPACRIFGMLEGGRAWAGRASIEDATADGAVRLLTCRVPFGTPKPTHRTFYYDAQNNPLGRKFYFHQPGRHVERGGAQTTRFEKDIRAADRGTRYACRVRFQGLDRADLALLLFACAPSHVVFGQDAPSIQLAPAEDAARLALKVGFGKAGGLGSTESLVHRLRLRDAVRFLKTGEEDVHQGAELATFLGAELAPYTKPKHAALLRMMLFDQRAHEGLSFGYQAQSWYKTSSQRRLRGDPELLPPGVTW
jgi:hypothetical protein